MNDVMGIIFSDDKTCTIDKLSNVRSLSALPFGGRYRIIDFMLSSFANSQVHNVGVTTQYKYHSLMDHISSGRPWDLERKTQGLFLLPPNLMKEISITGDRNNINILKGVESYVEHSRQKYVILAEASLICNIDFKELYHFHVDSGADVSIMYFRDVDNTIGYRGLDEVEVDDEGNVVDIFTSPRMNRSQYKFMKIIMMSKELMSELVDEAYAHKKVCNVIDYIGEKLNTLNVKGMEYRHYVRLIHDVHTYFNCNMEMLDHDIREEVFRGKNKIMTKVNDNSPTRHMPGSECVNSLIANGCRLSGRVENSILFRNVVVEEGATVKNSIIMQDSVIGKGSVVQNVIIDKDCVLGEKKHLIGQPNYPFVIAKGETV